MKKYIIVILIAFISTISFGQETDAVFKNISKEYILHADGSIEYKYSKVLQLNSQYAFNRLYGETFVVYNPDFQKVKINKAYTIMANGRKVEVPENAYNKVLPRAVSNYPAYNRMVELVITHTGLEVGATIYLDYSIISKPGYIREMLGTETMVERVPIENYNISLKVPARRNLQSSLYNSDLKPIEKNDGKYRSYTWSFNNLKAQAYEQSAPVTYSIAPTLVFSSFPNAKTELDTFTNQEAFNNEKVEGLDKFIDKTKKNTFSGMELALDIQKYIVNNINTKHIPLAWHNYTLQTPSQVWNNNIGSEIEKTLLLYRALQSAGLNVNVVGFYPLSLWGDLQSNLDNFSGFGVELNFKGGNRLFLSATKINTKTLELNYANHVIINIYKGTTVNPASLFSKPQIKLHANMTIDPDNQIFGDVSLALSGAAFNNIALMQDTQKVASYIANLPALKKDEKITADYSKSLEANFKFNIKGDGKLDKQANYYFWDIPHTTNGIAAQHFNQLPINREFPIIVDAIEEEYQYNITLPKSVVWVGQDIHFAVKESFGEMRIDIALKDGRLNVSKYLKIEPDQIDIMLPESRLTVESQQFQANSRQLSLEEYSVFRKMMIEWNADTVNELVFKK